MQLLPYSKEEALLLESRTVAAISRAMSKHSEVASVWTLEDGEMRLVSAGADVYDAIGVPGTIEALSLGQTIVAATGGWGAPADSDETAPSEHPDRVRVSLYVVFSTTNFISLMRADGVEEPHFADANESSGELKACVEHYALMARAKARRDAASNN